MNGGPGVAQTAAAWLRLAQVLDAMDDHGLACVEGMARWARANLPPELVCLVEVLDAGRGLAVAMMADRKGLGVAEVEAVIAKARAGGDHGG